MENAPEWYRIAEREAGTCEFPGASSNARIQDYFRAINETSTLGDHVPWCAAFVGFCLKSAGYPHSGSLLARSYSHYGQDVPYRRGAIIVLRRGAAWQGHVGFLDHMTGEWATLISGNSADCVRFSKYKRSSIVAVRWPLEMIGMDDGS